MKEQELKDPGKLHLLALGQKVLGKKYIEKQMPHPCYRQVAGSVLAKYRNEKSMRIAWMVLSIVEALMLIKLC